MKRTALLIAVTLVSSVTLADQVDSNNITTFQSNSPALAAEVNGNFSELSSAIDDNDARITALESPSTPANSVSVTVDCDENPDAVTEALDSSSLAAALDISASGTCNPVEVSRQYVSITGPVIFSSGTGGAGNEPLQLDFQAGVSLSDVTLDAESSAPNALVVRQGASLEIDNVTAIGATESNILIDNGSVTVDSLLSTSAIDDAVAITVQNNGTLQVDQAGNLAATSTNGCVLNVFFNSVFSTAIDGAEVSLSGSCIQVLHQSTLNLSNASVSTPDRISIGGGSSLNVYGYNGLSSTIGGFISASRQSTYQLSTDGTGSIATSGNIFLLSGSTLVASGGNIDVASGDGDAITMLHGNLTLVDGTTLSADSVNAFALNNSLYFAGSTAIATDTQFTLGAGSYFYGNNLSSAPNAANFSCIDANARARLSDNTDLCL